MNELANIYRGKSFSIGFTIPDEYDESRIEDLKVNIGTKVYQHTIVQGVIGVNLTSNDTAKMVGRQDVVLTIEDSLFGVQKLNCGYVYVSSTISKFQSESFSDVYDVMVMLSFYSERLSVDHVLFDYLKGKSAYEYAVEGGYLGTEEQFYIDLAKAAIAVPYTGADNDVDLGANGITVDNVIFNEEPVSTIAPLKLQYNPAEKTIEFGLKDGGILQLGKEMFEEYTNIDTVTITNGMIVSTAAIPGNRKGIKRTDFTNLTSIRSIVGMVTVGSIATNQAGRVTTKGIINDLNTNGWAEGSQLWGNPSVPGGWSGNKPAKPQYAVQIGQVVVASATVGSVELNVAKDVKFSDLADVNGSTNLIDNADTIPKRDADGIIREISVANVKAALKVDTDLLYEPLLGFTPENTANKGQANGYASLGADGLVPSNQLPSFVDDVLEFANLAAFPVTGEQGKIYVALDTNKTYRWSGSAYIYITSGAVDSVAGKTGVVTLVKGDVGLGNVDNTSDANKPVSTLQAAAIATKVGLTGNETVAGVKTFSSSPIVPNPTTSGQALNKGAADGAYVALTGAQNVAGVKTFTDSPVVPTPVNDTDAANKAYVQSVITVGNDTYQENKLITDARVSSLENVINSANINQETTATATGVDTVALPKTAANTGMQMQMFGQSAQNLVVNGDFRNGTTGILSLFSTIGASGGVLSVAGTGGNVNVRFGASITPQIIGNKLYFKSRLRVTNSVCISIQAIIRDAMGNAISSNIVTLNTPTSNEWYNHLGILTINANYATSVIEIGHQYADSATANGKVMEVDYFEVINLTATFGAGNEPTKEQCDVLFANYFEGSDNVLGAGRVRSVGNNLIKPTYIQGFQVSTTDGTFVAGATFSRSDYFRVAASTAYNLSSNTNTGTDHRIAFYDLNKVFISGANQTSGQPISVTSPVNAYYAIVSSLTTKVDTFRLTRGTSTFEPYRESILQLTTPALRSNGLIKDEIRKGANGYELVKRVGVGTLGSEKVVNGTFTTDTSNWTAVNSTLTVEDGMLKITNTVAGFGYTYQGFTTVIGKKYIVKLSHKNGTTSGLLRISNTTDGGNNYTSPALIDVNTTTRYATFVATATTTYIRLVSGGAIGDTTFFDNASIKEFTESEGLSTGEIFTELGSNVHYTLATPTITPITHAGLLNSNSNGTAYFEPIIADAGVYASNLAIQLTDYPISSFESIRKYANGTYTELNIATAVIASGGLSFTHPDLVSGDLVMFTYAYNKESIGRSMTLTHYDSRFVEADTANGKVYRWGVTITNGVPTLTVTEV